MRNRWIVFAALAILGACLVSILVYNLPPIHERLAWRVANLRSQIFYALRPPGEVVFIPQSDQRNVQTALQTNSMGPEPTPTVTNPPTLTLTPTRPGPTSTPPPSPTSTFTPTPIPDSVILTGIKHEYQQMNNCGPATLAMALSFWGWNGDQRDTRRFLRPNFANVDDKNVSPEEMATYVETFSELKALVRVGGNIDLLKQLVAAGFPVIIEKGFQPPKEDWMGHYEVINGYDDSRNRFITQDSYIMADFPLPYDQVSERWWRDFNHIYLVIYPPERENEVPAILGPDSDPTHNYERAAQRARDEIATLSGRDQFFAWYNLGTNQVSLTDYTAAAQAYDQAFAVYASLEEEERPWRTLWYQTGPYAAYYHTGRYQDVLNLANTTLSFLSNPILEETLYWRGLAKEALGDIQGGIKDLTRSAELNPNFLLAAEALRARGAPVP